MRNDRNTIARKLSEGIASGRLNFGYGGFNQREKKVQKIYNTATVSENIAYGAGNGKNSDALENIKRPQAEHAGQL